MNEAFELISKVLEGTIRQQIQEKTSSHSCRVDRIEIDPGGQKVVVYGWGKDCMISIAVRDLVLKLVPEGYAVQTKMRHS